MSLPAYARIASRDGQLTEASQLCVPALADGFMFGHGLFETIRVKEGRLKLFDDHWARLSASASALGLKLESDCERLKQRCAAVAAANGLGDGSVKVIVFQDTASVGELIFARSGLYPEDCYLKGFRLRIEKTVGRGFHAGFKTLNYLENIAAKRRAVSEGCDDTLFVTEAGEVLEGATTNIFVVSQGVVRTPKSDGRILPGVARGRVLRMLEVGSFFEGPIAEDELKTAEEVFVTNALLGVMPVSAVGERCFDLGRNPVTRGLMERFAGLD
jgi:branched-subunit amino acid aminotransferase/4-amino-4-deoxychorismate lyase